MARSVFVKLLLVLFVALTFGCAVAEPLEERSGLLELTVTELKVLDSRLNLAEERIDSLRTQLEDLHKIVLEPAPTQAASSFREETAIISAPVARSPLVQLSAGTDVNRYKEALEPAPAQAVSPFREKAAIISAPVARPPAVQPSAWTDASRYKEALETLQAGQAQRAEILFQDFMKTYPQSRLAPNAGYWLGEAYYIQKKYDLAILGFQDVVSKYPKHDKAAAALLKTGYAYNAMSDTANARFYLQQVLELYPRSEPASLARNTLARLK